MVATETQNNTNRLGAQTNELLTIELMNNIVATETQNNTNRLGAQTNELLTIELMNILLPRKHRITWSDLHQNEWTIDY